MTTAPTPDLLPCPFCGGPVRVLFRRVSNRRSGHFAECRSCEVRQGQPQPNRDAAVENWNRRAQLEARKPLPLSDDDRLRLRSDVARAIWDVMREQEDRCGHALEDVDHQHQVWDCADAAIRAMKDKP